MLIDLKEVHEIAHIPELIKFFLDLPCQHFFFEHVLSATLVVTATFAVQVDFANAFGHSAKQEIWSLITISLAVPEISVLASSQC